MATMAYLYKWTHLPTSKWYIGSRSANGCHPDDGYICSSHSVKSSILNQKLEWQREILVIGNSKYILELETKFLKILDAKNDPDSFNKHNGDGIYVSFGDKNPMKNPDIAKKVAKLISGDNHWTHNLGDKVHPQKGQKRPSISGNNHPNKKKENALKISQSHKGKKHEYMFGDKNIMRDPNIAAKLSGENHWTAKHQKLTCPHCGITCAKSNFVRWHNDNCKGRTT